ncbi:hypothetical protein GCM10027432_07630 [Lysobacter fragariae]
MAALAVNIPVESSPVANNPAATATARPLRRRGRDGVMANLASEGCRDYAVCRFDVPVALQRGAEPGFESGNKKEGATGRWRIA